MAAFDSELSETDLSDERLYNHRHKLGLNDTLVRRHETQPFDARCRDNRTIRGISQS